MVRWMLVVMMAGLVVEAGIPAEGQTGRGQRTRRDNSPAPEPARVELIQPLRNATFNKEGTARERKQGGNPRMQDGILVFDGSQDGDRQVDPQIAVGGGHVLHGTNSGLIVYDREGNFVQGVSQNAFNGGIDPKLFFDPHNRIFGFDLWNPWDEAKQKPVNISVSETDNPTGAWNTYPVPAPEGVDGGGIGYSRMWVGYTFPGGEQQTFVMKTAELKAGQPASVWHFRGNPGQVVAGQDPVDDLYFLKVTDQQFIVHRIRAAEDGTPRCELVGATDHGLEHVGYPPQSPQKGTDKKTSSGDRNPKNAVLQGGFIWFSQTVNINGSAGVQWFQLKTDGSIVQKGAIHDPQTNYIQTTLAVNRNLDVLVGFQETNSGIYISPRMAWRASNDPPGTLRPIQSLGDGMAATEGGPWGDYSGSVVDGDNLLDLWTIQSIADDEGKGDTVIARVPFPATAEPGSPNPAPSTNAPEQSSKAASDR